MFVTAYVVPLEREQEPDDEHIGMEKEGSVRHGRVVPRDIGGERDKNDSDQDQDVDP